MDLLLDTHTFLWCLLEGPQLGRRARQQVIDPANKALLSIASAMQASQIDWLPITLAHALAVRSLSPLHRDPFDRMLIAQARVEGLTIVTADEILTRYDVPTIDARV